MPYGYHTISIGLEEKNSKLFVPLAVDSLVQGMADSIRKDVIEWNVQYVTQSLSAYSEPISAYSQPA